MESISAKCLLCGKSYDLYEDHLEFKKVKKKEGATPTFICDMCSNRVRNESDEKRKPKKPM